MLLRVFGNKTYSNLILQDTYKILSNPFEHLNHVRKSQLYSSCYCSAYHLNDENRHTGKYGAALSLLQTGPKMLHTTAGLSQSDIKLTAFDFKKASSVFFNIKMVDLKQAPTPAFWLGILGLTPLWFPPITALIFGYSNFLTSGQYLYAAALLSCCGGIKWGSIINNKENETWENYALSIVPCVIAVIALSVPKLIGFLFLIGGFVYAFIIDLTTSNYPKWFLTLRGVLTNFSVFFLFLSFIQKLIH